MWVFLSAARERLAGLGVTGQVVGVDIDQKAWTNAKGAFPHFELILDDFFKILSGALGLFDAVIGNPPFIRYHYFTGESRARALALAAAKGVDIPALASAWAPFIVQAVSHLAPGGRLGMVAPYEVTYANYARPVVAYLAKSFNEVRCLTFDTPLFPALNEKTVLLLCSGFGGSTRQIAFHRFESSAVLTDSLGEPDHRVPVEGWGEGSAKAGLLTLPAEIRQLYLNLTTHAGVSRLGLTRSRPSVNRLEVAASALTSLAQLSAEIEGHPLGGGALKFEPGEARKWLLPYRPGSGSPAQPSPRVLGEIEELCRARSPGAQALADELFLHGGLGLKPGEVDALRDGAARLRAWRQRRRVENA